MRGSDEAKNTKGMPILKVTKWANEGLYDILSFILLGFYSLATWHIVALALKSNSRIYIYLVLINIYWKSTFMLN